MAESSGFFEAKWDDTIDNGDGTFGNWDRRYLADNFADYFKNFIGNGVFVSPTNQLKVSTSSGMNVQVSTGWAFIKGYWYHNDENKIITIPSNTGSTSRTDTIKARLNLNTRVITVDLYVNNNSVVRNDTYYDMILAQIVVPAYATTIPAANITDKRPDEAVCGFVKGLVEVITTDDLFDQFQAIFDEWFDGVKDQVTGDLAIRLQLEFTQLNSNVDTYYQNTNNNIAAYKTQMQNIVDTYQAAVEQQVDAAEDLVDGYVYNDYITDELTFTFVNNVCEISDSRVTPNSLLDLYFTKETIDEAENCQVNIESGVQKYIITCVKTPSMSLRGRIRVRVNSATPVVPPELDEFATKSWVNANFLNKEEGLYGASEIKTNDYGQFLTVTGGLMQKCLIDLEPIQSGSGTPSPSNVRPITGHTSVSVGNCGKNKLPLTVENVKSASTAGTWSGNKYTINGVTYELFANENGVITSIKATGTATANAPLVVYRNLLLKDGSYMLSGSPTGGSLESYRVYSTGVSASDTGSGASYIVSGQSATIACMISNGYAIPSSGVIFKPQIEVGSIKTDFEPYNGYTHVINLGGTYYGGKLDAVSGVGSTDESLIDLGDLTWQGKDTSDRFYAEINDIKPNATGDYTTGLIMCSAMGIDASVITSSSSASDFTIAKYTDSGLKRIYVKCSSISITSDFKTAVTGIKLLYQKATASSFSTTPEQIETLVGQNDVFAPLVGQTVDSLTYREVMAWDDVEKGIANSQRIEDITNEFTFSTDCTWSFDWTKIYKINNIIRGQLRFVTPSSVTNNKNVITIPSKYKTKNLYSFLGVLHEAFSGSVKGTLVTTNSQTDIILASNTWVASSNVLVNFEYIIE